MKQAIVIETENFLFSKEEGEDRFEVEGLIFAETKDEVAQQLKRYFSQTHEVNEDDVEIGNFAVPDCFSDEACIKVHKRINFAQVETNEFEIRLTIARQIDQ